MAYRELYVLLLLFFFVHSSLLTFGFVTGVAAYDNLNSQLSNLNPDVNANSVLEIQTESQIDPNTGQTQQQPKYVQIVTSALGVGISILGIIFYLLTGVYQTLQALYLPGEIVFIIGTIVSIIQYVGVLQFLLDIMAAIPRLF